MHLNKSVISCFRWQKIIVAVVACIAFLVSGHPSRAQSDYAGIPFVRNFQTIDYKAGIQNLAITQNKVGLLYVANNFGLLEFDGYQWQTYGVKSGTKLRSVAVDRRGRIYVGCQGDFGFFFPNTLGHLQYLSLADSLPKEYRNFDEAWSIFIDDGKVYFCTFSRIYIYDDGRLSVVEPGYALGHSFLVNRQLYVNETSHGISRLVGTSLEPLKGGEFFKNMGVASILPIQTDNLLVATSQGGIFVLSNGKVSPWNEESQSTFRESNINCMIRLKNGNYAIGTQNEGLLVTNADGLQLTQMTRGRGLENRTVLCIYEDELSNLWLGHNNGIAYVELGSPFTFIDEKSGLPGTGYTAFLNNDRLYLGTNTGVYLKSKDRLSGFNLVENTSGQVYHLGRYGDDFLAGHHKGALRLNGDVTKQISTQSGSWIFVELKGEPARMIEGTYSGLQLYEMNDGHWALKKKLGGFNESSRVMAEDAKGDLWVTHGYKGAYRITFNPEKDSITHVAYYGTDKGFASSRLINVFKVRNELVFTSESGVYKYDPVKDRFQPDHLFTDKLGDQAQVWFMQEDGYGNIYFAGKQQIGVLKKNTIGDYSLFTKGFSRIRKYLNDDLMNITILQNNEALFGAKDGFIHYDPAQEANTVTALNVLIRSVSVNAHGSDSVLFYGNYSQGDSVVGRQTKTMQPQLPYRDNSINFTFAVSPYEGELDLEYQYFLENYERDWSAWVNKTQKEYTQLKEGNYVFHVRARNSNGTMIPESTFAFKIDPPWYRSVVAYLFYGIVTCALLFSLYKLVDRRYQRTQQQMVLRQEQELSQKDSELEKLSQQSQEEITRLQNEKLESELRHMNNDLATATMHLLNKNEFITGVKTNLSSIAKRSVSDDLKKELLQITRDIEHNISSDSDWEHFQFHFDRVHGDFTSRFKGTFPLLSPQDTKLSAYLRMNLSSKEIAQMLNISVRGVEISRYRLRKKIGLDRNQNLQDFILNF